MDVTMLPRLLDSSNNEVRRIYPITLSINEKSVPLSTATMKVPKDQAVPDRSFVELFTPNGSAGIFRTRTPTEDFGSNCYNTYTLEHSICEIGDFLVRAEIEQTSKTLSAAITQVMGYYGGSKWQLGTVSATGNVILSANYSNLLQTINSLIDQVAGAIMTFDFSTSPWTFNVVSLSGNVEAEGRLSRNITKAQIKKDDTNLCTRVWLEGLSGGKMDADSATLEQYGVIEKKLTGRDYTATQASIVASSYLEKYKRPIYSITIDGMDFSTLTGETLDRLSIGKLYRLAIPEENITLTEYVVGIFWKDVLNTPTMVTLTLNEPNKTLAEFVHKQQSDYYGAGGEQEYQQKKNKAYQTWITQTDEYIELLAEYVDENGTILELAGLSLDAHGAIVYAENQVPGDDFLGSRLSVLSTGITTLVSKTGINDLGNTETLYSKIEQEADRIDLVVEGSGASASIKIGSIVDSINEQDTAAQSFVKIAADMVDIEGAAAVTSLENGVQAVAGDLENLCDGTLWADTLASQTLWTYGLVVQDTPGGASGAMSIFNQSVGYTDLTIDGNSYRFLTLS